VVRAERVVAGVRVEVVEPVEAEAETSVVAVAEWVVAVAEWVVAELVEVAGVATGNFRTAQESGRKAHAFRLFAIMLRNPGSGVSALYFYRLNFQT
jgi:hypothetical protein